jgi:lipopolysaccharide transport system permease protein
MVRIAANERIKLDIKEIFRYRELLLTLVARDVMVRYKQTILGFLWVVIQPVTIMVVFTIIFGHVAKLPSDGVPYSIFFYSALLPWNLFAEGINRSAVSMVANANLISKVYFPRIIIPIAGNTSPIIDFCVAFSILIGLMAYYGISLSLRMLVLPVLVLFAVFLSMSLGLWICSLNVKYRDFQYLTPFALQVLFYLSPIVYAGGTVPAEYRFIFSLNPMNVVITGFRWAVYDAMPPDIISIVIAVAITIGIFVTGFIYFKSTERYFADMI